MTCLSNIAEPMLPCRSVYTKRIIDISAKVRKQKQEIDRVLADTRTIQKEINILSGKLERTFTVVEGTAYKVREGKIGKTLQ